MTNKTLPISGNIEDPCADCNTSDHVDACVDCEHNPVAQALKSALPGHPQGEPLEHGEPGDSVHSNVGRGVVFTEGALRNALDGARQACEEAKAGKPMKLQPAPPIVVSQRLKELLEGLTPTEQQAAGIESAVFKVKEPAQPKLVECDECLYRRFPWQQDGAASWCYMFHQRVPGCRAGAKAKPLKPTVVVDFLVKAETELKAGDVVVKRSDGTVEAAPLDHIEDPADPWRLRDTLIAERDRAAALALWHAAQALGHWAGFRWVRAAEHARDACDLAARAVRLAGVVKDGEES